MFSSSTEIRQSAVAQAVLISSSLPHSLQPDVVLSLAKKIESYVIGESKPVDNNPKG